MSKYVTFFKTTTLAKEYIERIKALPYVGYTSDFMTNGGRKVLAEIEGDLTPERVSELNSLKKPQKTNTKWHR